MSTEITATQSTDLLSPKDIEVLRDSKFKGFTDPELKYAIQVSSLLKLNPLLNQVHFVKRKNKDGTYTISTQVGIDGLRLAAQRAGGYAGSDDIVFEGIEGNEFPEKATASVYRIVQGLRCAFTASARWEEYFPQNEKDQFMWRRMPHTMLGKCAEALALRKAFPSELAGVVTDEEMVQANHVPSKAGSLNSRTAIEEAELVDAVEDLGNFICEIGNKYKQTKLSDIPPSDIQHMLTLVENVKEPTKLHLEFKEKATAYLKSSGGEL